jgi:excisionase family DNA binding protein
MAVEAFTVPEVGKRLRLTPGRVYSLIRTGRLSAVRLGRQVRVTPSAVEKLLSEGCSPMPHPPHDGGRAP